MAEPVEDSRIVIPTILTLSRLALIKVALPFWKDFEIEVLDVALQSIESERKIRDVVNEYRWNLRKSGCSSPPESTIIDHASGTRIKCKRAKQRLLLIPSPLRKKVVEAVYGLAYEVKQWGKSGHPYLKNPPVFYFRSDGSIDRIKTVQQLVVNTNIDIKKRFSFACMYCMEDSLKTLWPEIKETYEMHECYDNNPYYRDSYSMEAFWARRMRSGSRVPWPQTVVPYLKSPSMCYVVPKLACCSIFPLLQPADRKLIFSFLRIPVKSRDDFRLCLNAMTKEEYEEIMENNPLSVLYLFLQWPLRSLFLEMVEKARSYNEGRWLGKLLYHIFDEEGLFRDVSEHGEIVEHLWNMSSESVKEDVRYWRFFWKIEKVLNEMKKKRKAVDDMNEQFKKRLA